MHIGPECLAPNLETTALEQTSPVRKSFFGVTVDPITMIEAVGRIQKWILPTTCTEASSFHQARRGCRFVVTPNVDHIVMLQSDVGLQAAYRDASLVLVDGFPVVWASRLVGRGVPERVAGSDLVPALFSAFLPEQQATVFLLGAAPGVADRAATIIERQWPGTRVVGTYSPPLGFEKDPHENENILNRIAGVAPDILIVGLGAPKQELWVHRFQSEIHAKAALCVGATIDFIAGEKRRAPVWMRRCGLEWLHRLGSEPRRLTKRYFQDGVIFPRLVLRELVRRSGRQV